MYIKQRMLVIMVAALVLSYTADAAEIQFLTHNTQSDDVIQQWQSALDALKSSGKYDELIRRYLIPANKEE